MFNIFQHTTPPDRNLFFKKNDKNDARLGEIVLYEPVDYESSQIVILGCPQDEGVARNKGRIGAALAPAAIRAQFYKLTDFGISQKIFDAGDTIIQSGLEETHDLHTKIVKQILSAGKTLIVLGGGNDISYADGVAMAEVFGNEEWLAFNIDAHFDVRAESPRNSGTPYRQLLKENLLLPSNFYEIAWQPQANSKIYYDFLKNSGVTLVSLEEIQTANFKSLLAKACASRKFQAPIFFGFDVDSVRASDAPGVSASSPIGLTADEFIASAGLAGNNAQTRIIEFTETNPNFDIDNRTAKLVAVAMHRFCAEYKQKSQPKCFD